MTFDRLINIQNSADIYVTGILNYRTNIHRPIFIYCQRHGYEPLWLQIFVKSTSHHCYHLDLFLRVEGA